MCAALLQGLYDVYTQTGAKDQLRPVLEKLVTAAPASVPSPRITRDATDQTRTGVTRSRLSFICPSA